MNRVRFCARKLPSIQLHFGALGGNSAIFNSRFFKCKCLKYSKHFSLIQNREIAFTGIFHFHLTKGTILNKYVYFPKHLKKFYKSIILNYISHAKNQSHSPLRTGKKKALFFLKQNIFLNTKMQAHMETVILISTNEENLVKSS